MKTSPPLLILLILLLLTSCAASPCKKSIASRCKHGDGAACFYQGSKILSSLEKVSDKKIAKQIKKDAVLWFKKGCKLKHSHSCQQIRGSL
ncbi:MAG: hypothetical protein HN509_11735 [Halobacteriovoraceae bacterium]|nr:hypothetical protein [Halobacteriovoraceae bacterium]MBT5093596.1 hypothetical protein [Halobacteriovoraceae bacterium]